MMNMMLPLFIIVIVICATNGLLANEDKDESQQERSVPLKLLRPSLLQDLKQENKISNSEGSDAAVTEDMTPVLFPQLGSKLKVCRDYFCCQEKLVCCEEWYCCGNYNNDPTWKIFGVQCNLRAPKLSDTIKPSPPPKKEEKGFFNWLNDLFDI
nr:uncharacterized protein LOC106682082 [Halyomorpha halys]